MTEMKDKVAAFVGPDESCVSEALVAAAWNKAIISYVSQLGMCIFSFSLANLLFRNASIKVSPIKHGTPHLHEYVVLDFIAFKLCHFTYTYF